MLNLVNALSDVSKTNQVRILDAPEVVAEKLFIYLHQLGRGVETFNIRELNSKIESAETTETNSESTFRNRHKRIKIEIQKKMEIYGKKVELSSIQYFLSPANGNIFFLSPNNNHSGWRDLFCKSSSD